MVPLGPAVAGAFLLGVLWIQLASRLYPAAVWLAAAALALLLARWSPAWRKIGALVGIMLIAASYATWRAQMRLDTRVPEALDKATVSCAGVVVGLPEYVDGGVRFQFRPDGEGLEGTRIGRLAVSWYPEAAQVERRSQVYPGARLRLSLRPRRITSHFNPGGHDHAGAALAQGVAGRAYVLSLDTEAASEASGSIIDMKRARLRDWIERRVDADMAGPMVAMVIGDQRGISAEQWSLFRETGTAHLVAISGLHVSIVAGLIGACVAMLWRRFPFLVQRLPARQAAIVAGVLAALCYAALAGFGLPVMRAVIMLGVAALALLLRRRSDPLRVLWMAMIAVLLFDPWAVLSAGFWLSFTAVFALLLVLSGRLGSRTRWQQFLIAQWAISMMTLPIALGIFGAPSIISPLANAIAIPWVSLVLVPVLLLATATGSALLLSVSAWCLEQLMAVLTTMMAWSPAIIWIQPPLWLVVIACAGLVLALLPAGTPLRRFGLLCAVPLLCWRPSSPTDGTARITVIDVGQGLSVLVQTARHTMLYDTGRAFYRGGDAGRSIVLPALRHAGVARLDMMVLSHDDNDHAGGASSVADELEIEHVVGGVGTRLMNRQLGRCESGDAWRWDGVEFSWVYPAPGQVASTDNDRSCVLLIRAEDTSVLLTGDITQAAEAQLLSARELAGVSVVVAPHHGSQSSSSLPFVRHVSARHVVFAAGYRNAYRHPAQRVVERWQAHGARAWNTAEAGAVTIELDGQGAHVSGNAVAMRRYWHRQ